MADEQNKQGIFLIYTILINRTREFIGSGTFPGNVEAIMIVRSISR